MISEFLSEKFHFFGGKIFGNKTIHRQDNSSTRFLETIHRHEDNSSTLFEDNSPTHYYVEIIPKLIK